MQLLGGAAADGRHRAALMAAAPSQAARPLSSATPPFAAIDSAPCTARGHVKATLAGWDLAGFTDTTALIASELVSNAVAASAIVPDAVGVLVIRMCLITNGDVLTIECWDQAPGVPVLRQAQAEAETGRGLTIIDALTGGAWGCQPAIGQAGKCVWAEIPLHNTPDAGSWLWRPTCLQPLREHPRSCRQARRPELATDHEAGHTGHPANKLEVTQFSQLKCAHCYSESGPDGGRGSMTPDDWERLMGQAAQIGVRTVQFIGGEPTLDPDLPRLARHALAAGLEVDVYTNLVHVTPELWELFAQPGVSVGFSWYSADPGKHAEVTGSRASHARTAANVAEAVRRGIQVRAGIVEVVEGQDIEGAKEALRALGVTDIVSDRARGVGRAAHGAAPVVSELCGRCGKGRAAIGMDGQLTPCVLGRFLIAGNVKNTPLGDRRTTRTCIPGLPRSAMTSWSTASAAASST